MDKIASAMELFATKEGAPVPLPGYDPGAPRHDRLNALSGLDFKVKLPTINDSEPDLDKHLMVFVAVL